MPSKIEPIDDSKLRPAVIAMTEDTSPTEQKKPKKASPAARKASMAAFKRLLNKNSELTKKELRSLRLKQYAATVIALVELFWTVFEVVLMFYLFHELKQTTDKKNNDKLKEEIEAVEGALAGTLGGGSNVPTKVVFAVAHAVMALGAVLLLMGIWGRKAWMILPYMFLNTISFVLRCFSLQKALLHMDLAHSHSDEKPEHGMIRRDYYAVFAPCIVAAVKLVFWFGGFAIWKALMKHEANCSD